MSALRVPNPRHPMGGCNRFYQYCQHNVPPLRSRSEIAAFARAWDLRVAAGVS